jgi:hypothetical protein
MVIRRITDYVTDSLKRENRDEGVDTSIFVKIQENLWNPKYYEAIRAMSDLMGHIIQISFHPALRDRISPANMPVAEIMTKDTDNALFVTDMPFFAEKYDCIGMADIPTFPDMEKRKIILAFSQDFLVRETVDALTARGLKYHSLFLSVPTTRYYNTDRNAYDVLLDESSPEKRLIHYCPPDFENIFQALAATRDLQGAYVEVGVFQGASSHAALNYMRRAGIHRESWFLDTYEGFTYDEAQDSEDQVWKNSHQETSIDRVKNYLSEFSGVHVVKNNCISDPFPEEIGDIAVANLDVDMYEAVKAGLKSLATRVVRNGILIAEDYGHTPLLIGAQKAVHEFLEENPGVFTPLYMSSGQIFLVKRG